MDADRAHRAWAAQAQADAERGVLECRMCRTRGPLDEALSVWRNGVLVFAVCARCCTSHEVVLRPTDRGTEVRGRRVGPLIIGAGT